MNRGIKLRSLKIYIHKFSDFLQELIAKFPTKIINSYYDKNKTNFFRKLNNFIERFELHISVRIDRFFIVLCENRFYEISSSEKYYYMFVFQIIGISEYVFTKTDCGLYTYMDLYSLYIQIE